MPWPPLAWSCRFVYLHGFHHKSSLFWLLSSLLCAHEANDSSLIQYRLLFLDESLCLLKWSVTNKFLVTFVVNLRLSWAFVAASTNASVLTPFGLIKRTMNYVCLTLLPKLLPYKIAGTEALTPISMNKNQQNINSCALMTPIDMSKIIFPLNASVCCFLHF